MTNTTQDSTMKQRSQSSELTGSLVASDSDSATTDKEPHTTPPPSIDFMYNWIRKNSGRVKLD